MNDNKIIKNNTREWTEEAIAEGKADSTTDAGTPFQNNCGAFSKYYRTINTQEDNPPPRRQHSGDSFSNFTTRIPSIIIFSFCRRNKRRKIFRLTYISGSTSPALILLQLLSCNLFGHTVFDLKLLADLANSSNTPSYRTCGPVHGASGPYSLVNHLTELWWHLYFLLGSLFSANLCFLHTLQLYMHNTEDGRLYYFHVWCRSQIPL